jgi:hypothetical protein
MIVDEVAWDKCYDQLPCAKRGIGYYLAEFKTGAMNDFTRIPTEEEALQSSVLPNFIAKRVSLDVPKEDKHPEWAKVKANFEKQLAVANDLLRDFASKNPLPESDNHIDRKLCDMRCAQMQRYASLLNTEWCLRVNNELLIPNGLQCFAISDFEYMGGYPPFFEFRLMIGKYNPEEGEYVINVPGAFRGLKR